MFLETSRNPSLSLSPFLALCVSLCLSLSLSLSHSPSLSHSLTHTHTLLQMSTVLSANKMKSHDLATLVFLFVYIAVFDFRHPFPVILGMVYSRVYHITSMIHYLSVPSVGLRSFFVQPLVPCQSLWCIYQVSCLWFAQAPAGNTSRLSALLVCTYIAFVCFSMILSPCMCMQPIRWCCLEIVKLCFDQDSSPPGNPENPYKIHRKSTNYSLIWQILRTDWRPTFFHSRPPGLFPPGLSLEAHPLWRS